MEGILFEGHPSEVVGVLADEIAHYLFTNGDTQGAGEFLMVKLPGDPTAWSPQITYQQFRDGVVRVLERCRVDNERFQGMLAKYVDDHAPAPPEPVVAAEPVHAEPVTQASDSQAGDSAVHTDADSSKYTPRNVRRAVEDLLGRLQPPERRPVLLSAAAFLALNDEANLPAVRS